MRAWARFRVVLNPKDGLLTVSKSSDCAVVQIQMRDVDASRGQGISIQRKTMVLTRDLHLTSRSTGMIESAMAVGQFEGAAPKSEAENLRDRK